ncbi:ABC transporter permease [Sphaerisporangium sp. NPDC051011]|uniref:ABC transporter permease n=1 Tax=Sphaerisporangium sp. NPDC051011 TaxID=3155792 RepID=UPI0033C250EE
MRRLLSIGRAELLLLGRNRTALFNAVLLPVAIIGLLAATRDRSDPTGGAVLLTGLLGFVLVGVLYYTLVSTYVARREELVLKRLRTGSLTDTEILIGTAGPTVTVALGQMLLFVTAGAVVLGLRLPVNALVLLVGVLAGTAVFVLLAAASSAFTRTVELAQVTTLPVLMVCLVGAALPPDTLPAPVAEALRWLPLAPTLDLLRLGWLGTTGPGPAHDFVGVLGAAAAPAGLLAVWMVLGWLAVRRWFSWEPRR